MKNIIIGTAGHVDHGKTCLIKALTGIETDRLEEEKKRGITIELGFAYLDLPNGEKAGIIDVPGHERFIKNMLAGAGGMDMVLLVVAADEGIMPQTREHLGILSMLGMENGIVVLTKSDIVEEDWLEFVMDDVRSELNDTFLSKAKIMPVSSYNGEGIEELKQEIVSVLEKTKPKNINKNFRMPVDRAFSKKGFGTVVTGTLIEGSLNIGDNISIYPEENITKIRNIQVHGQAVDTAYAGQRVAINLNKLKKDEVMRGDTLAQPDSMEQTMMLDVKLNLFSDTSRIVENNSMVHFYHGTRNVLSKVVLLNRDSLKSGESCYAQLRFNENIAVKNGDHYIIRFYSPIETIGGGEILDANPVKHKRNNQAIIKSLEIKEKGTMTEKVLQAVKEYSKRFENLEYLSKRLMIDTCELKDKLSKIDPSELVEVSDNIIVHAGFMELLRSRMYEFLKEHHEKNPLEAGMKLDELKYRLMPKIDAKTADAVIDVFANQNAIKVVNQKAALSDFEISIDVNQRAMIEELDGIYLQAGFSVPSVDEVQENYKNNRAAFKQVIEYMVDNKTLINITAHIYLHKNNFLKAIDEMEKIQNESGEISLGDFRDRVGTSRKYALPILEYCDKIKVTKRLGDQRKLDSSGLQNARKVL